MYVLTLNYTVNIGIDILYCHSWYIYLYIHTHLTIGLAFTPCLNVEAFGLMVSANRFLECHHAPWLSFCAVYFNRDCSGPGMFVRFWQAYWLMRRIGESVGQVASACCMQWDEKHLICEHKNNFDHKGLHGSLLAEFWVDKLLWDLPS